MAKTDSLTNEQKEIVRAQNDALLYLPEDRETRLSLILNYRREKARENDLIAQAKKESGAGDTLKKLIEQKHLKPQAIKTINLLAEMEASARAIAVRQIISYAEDFNWVIPDLFDRGAIGQQAGANDAPVFDSTSEGQRRGGSKAEPRPAPKPAAAAPAREIPTLSLEEAQKVLDAELAKRDGKRGPEPKSLKEARAAVEMAKALETEKGMAADGGATEQPAAAPPAPPAGDNVVSFAKQQANANAAGEAHIREQAAKLQADREAKERGDKPTSTTAAPPPPMDDDPDLDPEPEAVTEAAPAEKPKRGGGRKKKDTEAVAAPPPPPPADDEDEEADQEEGSATFPGGAPVLGAGAERRSPDFRIG